MILYTLINIPYRIYLLLYMLFVWKINSLYEKIKKIFEHSRDLNCLPTYTCPNQLTNNTKSLQYTSSEAIQRLAADHSLQHLKHYLSIH